jgi:hypothetical protein
MANSDCTTIRIDAGIVICDAEVIEMMVSACFDGLSAARPDA